MEGHPPRLSLPRIQLTSYFVHQVTGMTPTKAGEGKTTTTVGLTDSLRRLNQNAVACLREPSLGPVFGLKGGATGGGHAQVVPMGDINLHFNGDFHAITSAHNLLSAMVDNHIYFKQEPQIDVRRVQWKRVLDMNDRALRKCPTATAKKIRRAVPAMAIRGRTIRVLLCLMIYSRYSPPCPTGSVRTHLWSFL